MKVFILGLDALEYDFIEDWNLQNLKQTQFGKLRVPINEVVRQPSTPEVWASFLCGKHVKKQPFAVYGRSRWNRKVTALLKALRKLMPFHLHLGLAARLQKKPIRFPELGERSFLDHPKIKPINVPYYNFDQRVFDVMFDFARGNLSHDEAIRRFRNLYVERKLKLLLQCTDKKLEEFRGVFTYFYMLDPIQHFYMDRVERMKRFYNNLNDDFVPRLKRNLEKWAFIIVSDHGYSPETQHHTNYGFYSSNIPLNPKPAEIYDFYHIILKATGEPT